MCTYTVQAMTRTVFFVSVIGHRNDNDTIVILYEWYINSIDYNITFVYLFVYAC